MASLRHTTNQRVLRHADRRKVESYSRVARDSEESGMQTAVTVNEEDVRSLFEATNGCLDSRKLAISQECRGVRKIDVIHSRGTSDWFWCSWCSVLGQY